MMASRWSDEDVAAPLNRMGVPTAQEKTWTAHRGGSMRRVRRIHAIICGQKGDWLAQREAAANINVSRHQIGRLIKARILAAEQVVPDALHQIPASDLHDNRVTSALARKGRLHRRAWPRGLPGTTLGKIATRHARRLLNTGTLSPGCTAQALSSRTRCSIEYRRPGKPSAE